MAPLKRVKSLSLLAESTVVNMLSKIKWEWDMKDDDEDDEKHKIIHKLQAYFNEYTNAQCKFGEYLGALWRQLTKTEIFPPFMNLMLYYMFKLDIFSGS